MAVTVNAAPEHIWPWSVQIGYRRGGVYSYDRLDRLFGYLDRPSATRILPEGQHPVVGDQIPGSVNGSAADRDYDPAALPKKTGSIASRSVLTLKPVAFVMTTVPRSSSGYRRIMQ